MNILRSRTLTVVRTVLVSSFVIMGLSGASSAATVDFFTDKASFLSQLATSTTIDFEGIVGNASQTNFGTTTVIDTVTFSVSTGTLGVSGANGPVSGNPYDSALLFSNNSAPLTVDLTSAGSGFTALGGFFGDIDSAGTGATLKLFGISGLLASQTITTADMGAGTASNFFGFTVTGDDITSLTFDLAGNFEGIDDLVFGTAVSVVPLPAALPIFLTGLVGLGAVARRKKRQRAQA